MPFPVQPSTAPGAVPFRTTPDLLGAQVGGHTILVEAAGAAVPVSTAAPLPVGAAPGSMHDASGLVGTVSAQVLAAGTRTLLDIQNVGTTPLGLNFGGAATIGAGSIVLQPGGSLRYAAPGFVPTDAVTAISAGSGGSLTLKWG